MTQFQTVAIGPGDLVRAHLPGPDERRSRSLGEDAPLWVVIRRNGRQEVYLGEHTTIVVRTSAPA